MPGRRDRAGVLRAVRRGARRCRPDCPHPHGASFASQFPRLVEGGLSASILLRRRQGVVPRQPPMFTFFGLFADPVSGLSEQISRTWPGLNVVKMEQPISAGAGSFCDDTYESGRADTPEPVIRTARRLSREVPAATYLLLRTERWGGMWARWCQIAQPGRTFLEASGHEALRRWTKRWGVDAGPTEFFAPLGRDFTWE